MRIAATVLAALAFAGVAAQPASAGTWTPQNATGTTLTSVSCPAATTCFAVGQKGIVLVTTDGGATWSYSSSGTANNLNSVYCVSVSTCFAAGSKGGAGTNATILTTTDGGANWSAQNS